MIAKIGRGSNLYGALAYNNTKVQKEKAEILLAHNIIETPDGQYTVAQLADSFKPYLAANRNTEKHTLHISLNPDPKDQVNDEMFRAMAEDYMSEMGYGEQPFVVFKHMDIDRTHIHIVTVAVDQQGRKISDRFEKKRSMEICRALEKKFALLPATKQHQKSDEKIFQPVNYKAGNVKNQIASVIRHLPTYYRFRTIGEYNALLSLFLINVEKIEGEQHQGLLYFALDADGKKAGHPYKASLFGKSTTLSAVESYMTKCKETLQNDPCKKTVINILNQVLQATNNERDCIQELVKRGINTIIRRNDSGRIYGITFIDHTSKTVWNGSALGKAYSANIFNELWKSKAQHQDIHLNVQRPETEHPETEQRSISGGADLTDLLGIFEPVQREDYEELDFERRMKMKRKKRKL